MRYFKETEGFYLFFFSSAKEKHGIVTTSQDYTLKKRDLSLPILKSPSFENVSECTMTILHF